MTDWKGQSVLVTGAASGLGLATVKHFAALGANLVMMDLPKSNGRKVADELGKGVAFVPGDVTVSADVQSAVNTATAMGPLRLAVAAAGIGPPSKLFDENGPIPAERMKAVFEVNLLGTYNVLACAGHAISGNDVWAGDRGVIVMTASIAGYEGPIGQTAYSGSKAGVIGMTLPAARELARYAIRVMAIAPGLFDTPLLASMPEKSRQSAAAQVPHPSRLGRPEEFAQLVEAICSTKLLNGEVIRLDGAIRMAPK